MCISIGHLSIGHLSALCQEIVSPLSNWESDTLGNTQIRRPLWERTAFSRSNWPYPSDIPADGSANGSSPREKFLGTSENTRWKLRWVEEVGPQPESRAIANAKWLRDNFCLSSLPIHPSNWNKPFIQYWMMCLTLFLHYVNLTCHPLIKNTNICPNLLLRNISQWSALKSISERLSSHLWIKTVASNQNIS